MKPIIISTAIALALLGIVMAMNTPSPEEPHGPRISVSPKAAEKMGRVVVPRSFVLPTIGSE